MMKKRKNLNQISFLILTFLCVSQVAHAIDVAKINNKVLTDNEIKTALGGFSEAQRKEVLKNSDSKREIIQSLVDQELLVQEGEKQKLDQDEQYKKALENFKRQYLSSKILEKSLSSKLSDSAAKEFYGSHKRKYSSDRVQVQHILVDTEAKANEVMKKAKEKDADFQKLAEANSKDPSVKTNRGDVGVVTWDAPFVREFKEAAFSGKEGSVVGPIKTAYGYHVIKVIEKKMGKIQNYEEVELKVKNDLKQELIEDYVTKLRKAAKVMIDEKAIEKL